MTDQHSADQSAVHGDAGHPTAVENPFRRDEWEQFDQDDVHAGKALGKLLSSFFLYTVIAMAIVVYWTYNKLAN